MRSAGLIEASTASVTYVLSRWVLFLTLLRNELEQPCVMDRWPVLIRLRAKWKSVNTASFHALAEMAAIIFSQFAPSGRSSINNPLGKRRGYGLECNARKRNSGRCSCLCRLIDNARKGAGRNEEGERRTCSARTGRAGYVNGLAQPAARQRFAHIPNKPLGGEGITLFSSPGPFPPPLPLHFPRAKHPEDIFMACT